MYIVEKIGDLILITIENTVSQDEIITIKSKLRQLSEVSKNDVVVSIYCENENNENRQKIENEINELSRYCSHLGLRVYSYKS
jgi:hypothetical protein